MKNIIKLSNLIFLLLLSYILFSGFSCNKDYNFYISNQSTKDVRVLSIERSIDDTINRFILEPGTTHPIDQVWPEWYDEMDSIKSGIELIITQDSNLLKKNYKDWSNWGSGNNDNNTLIIRDEDF